MRIVNDPQELAKPVQRCFADPCPILARILPADGSRDEEDTAHRQGFGTKTPRRIIGSARKPKRDFAHWGKFLPDIVAARFSANLEIQSAFR